MTLQERETLFLQEVHRFDYDQNILSEFFEYWSEPNRSGKKMKFELEKTWDTGRRLKRWINNKNNWNGQTNGKTAAESKWDARVEYANRGRTQSPQRG